MKRILLVRPDRIGDVVLSLPVARVIRERYPNAEIFWLVRELTSPIVQSTEGVAGFVIYKPETTHRGFAGALNLAKELREKKNRCCRYVTG